MSGPNVGYATLTIIPSAKGIKGRLGSELTGPLSAAGGNAGAGAARSFSSRFTGGLRSMAGTVTKAGTALFAGLGVAAVAAAPKILAAGASMEALEVKSRTVFSGGALAEVRRWSKVTAASMGVTTAEAVGMAAATGDLLKPMGFTADQAAGMSTKLLDLSGALSAWSGGTKSASDVSNILTSALLGERESLKSLGISISAADVEQRLAAKGQDRLTGAALQQAEALATQELIFEKSTDAQKAWADGSMDGLKAQNKMKAGLGTLKESLLKAAYPLVKSLVPALTSAATWMQKRLPGAIAVAKQWFTTHLLPPMQKVVAWVKANWPEISRVIGVAFGHIGRIASWLRENVLRPLGAALGQVVAWVRRNWPQISATVTWVARRIGDYFSFIIKKLLPTLVNGIRVAVRWISNAWTTTLYPAFMATGRWLQSMWSKAQPIIRTVGAVIGGVVAGVKWAFDNVFMPGVRILWSGLKVSWAIAKPILGTIKTVISGALTAVKWAFDNILAPAVRVLGTVFSTAWAVAKPIIDTIRSTVLGVISTIQSAIDKLREFTEGKTLSNIASGVAEMTAGGQDPDDRSFAVKGRKPPAERFAASAAAGRALDGAGGGGGNTTINLPPGANGRDVVAAQRRYDKRNGRR